MSAAGPTKTAQLPSASGGSAAAELANEAASVGDTPMAFDAFLDQAWADHGDAPVEVAQRLEQGYALIESPAQIAPFARILAHVDGEHLARWEEGAARLERLRAHPLWDEHGDAPTIVRRLLAALRFGSGDDSVGDLDPADRAHAHSVTAAAFVAQGRQPEAFRHFRAGIAAAAGGLDDNDPAVRALAVTANNLAAALEEMTSRSTDETAVMLEAARAARIHWARAGGWLETERAEYLLAKCHLAAGDAKSALVHARHCVAICEGNDADAFERFFAQGVRALAHRALADDSEFAQARAATLAHYAALAPDQKPWCGAMLALLA
jgi:hypothetical protein